MKYGAPTTRLGSRTLMSRYSMSRAAPSRLGPTSWPRPSNWWHLAQVLSKTLRPRSGLRGQGEAEGADGVEAVALRLLRVAQQGHGPLDGGAVAEVDRQLARQPLHLGVLVLDQFVEDGFPRLGSVDESALQGGGE